MATRFEAVDIAYLAVPLALVAAAVHPCARSGGDARSRTSAGRRVSPLRDGPARRGRALGGMTTKPSREQHASHAERAVPARLGGALWLCPCSSACSTLAINYSVGVRAGHRPPRVDIPLALLPRAGRAGNVRTITSTGAAVQGELKRSARYPAGRNGTRTTQFATEIPDFANTASLSHLLQSNGVVINAKPLESGATWWQSLLYGFGPTLLFLVLCSGLRRAAAGGVGLLGSFGQPRPCARRSQRERVTRDVAVIDEARRSWPR